jgi:pyridoxal phosphate enzyme (YggS family)
MTNERRTEIQRNLDEVNARVDAACVAAHRPRSSVHLLAVTKTFPASDVDVLAELGCTDVGESRDQEARAKKEEVQADLRWHMIGQVQRKKAKQIAMWADLVESVDRPELADALQLGAQGAHKHLGVLIQISLDPAGTQNRGGVDRDQVEALAEHILTLSHLTLAGVMAVAPLGSDPEAAFALLASAHQRLLSVAPGAQMVSAGMSGDLEAAIVHGATQVRIGGALLGNRPPLT